MTKVLVLNGVNLGRLGSREPQVYGATTHAQLSAGLIDRGHELGLDVEVRQTDDEAVMIGWLHEAADTGASVVHNPGAWSHNSYALRDAVSLVHTVIEVHLSQTAAREAFRHHSVVSAVVKGTITGLGVEGYRAAIRALTA